MFELLQIGIWDFWNWKYGIFNFVLFCVFWNVGFLIGELLRFRICICGTLEFRIVGFWNWNSGILNFRDFLCVFFGSLYVAEISFRRV